MPSSFVTYVTGPGISLEATKPPKPTSAGNRQKCKINLQTTSECQTIRKRQAIASARHTTCYCQCTELRHLHLQCTEMRTAVRSAKVLNQAVGTSLGWLAAALRIDTQTWNSGVPGTAHALPGFRTRHGRAQETASRTWSPDAR